MLSAPIHHSYYLLILSKISKVRLYIYIIFEMHYFWMTTTTQTTQTTQTTTRRHIKGVRDCTRYRSNDYMYELVNSSIAFSILCFPTPAPLVSIFSISSRWRLLIMSNFSHWTLYMYLVRTNENCAPKGFLKISRKAENSRHESVPKYVL